MKLNDIKALDKQHYMPTFGERTPVAFERGDGAWLWDTEGKRYLDCFCGIAVTSLGHNHPAVTKAITEQAQKLLHTSNLYYIEPQARLAGLLTKYLPCDRVFIANTGAEANEGLFKLVRKFFKGKGEERYEIITAGNSFHGRTLANVAATGQPKYQAPYTPLPQGFVNVPFNDLDAVKAAITPRTAAVLLETVQGEGGVVPGDPAYLKAVEALCREQGILFLLDEVQTGMGRTGSWVSFTQLGLSPDAFTLAKALGNGVPIGAICATEPLASAFSAGDHGTTFGGNPLVCAAACAVMEIMVAEDIPAQAASMGAYIKEKLEAVAAKHPCVTDIRSMGMMFGLQLAPEIKPADIVSAVLAKGVVVGTANLNTLRILPPLNLTHEQADMLANTLDEVLP